MRALLLAICLLCAGPGTGWAQDTAETIAAANAEVAAVYRAGRFADALDLARDNLRRAEEALGTDHPETLTSVNNLAFWTCRGLVPLL